MNIYSDVTNNKREIVDLSESEFEQLMLGFYNSLIECGLKRKDEEFLKIVKSSIDKDPKTEEQRKVNRQIIKYLDNVKLPL